MGMLDREWYKDHHQGKNTRKHHTLDKDHRELLDPAEEIKPFRFTLLHFLLLSLAFLCWVLWYFLGSSGRS